MNVIKIVTLTLAAIFFLTVCEDRQGREPAVSLEPGGAEIKPAASLSVGRADHTATKLNDGSVLVLGGMSQNGEFHATAEIFDPKTGSFKLLSSRMTKQRVSHTATLLKDNTVLIVGGWSNRSAPESSAEIFDPNSGLFTAVGETAFRRSGHTASLLPNGDVLIAGGRHGSDPTRSLEIFDVKKKTFRDAGNMIVPRSGHTATELKNGKILFVGGRDVGGSVTAEAEVWDFKTRTAEKMDSRLETARYKHDSVLLADGRVLVFGGSNERDRGGRFKSAEVFDPVKRRFEKAGDMHSPRFKINSAAVLLKDGRVLIAGGSEQAELFDPSTETFSLVKGSFGEEYHFASATLLDDGRALIVGGYEYGPATGPVSTSGAWLFTS